MSENSNIEWTNATVNPWEGCQKVAPGCSPTPQQLPALEQASGHVSQIDCSHLCKGDRCFRVGRRQRLGFQTKSSVEGNGTASVFERGLEIKTLDRQIGPFVPKDALLMTPAQRSARIRAKGRQAKLFNAKLMNICSSECDIKCAAGCNAQRLLVFSRHFPGANACPAVATRRDSSKPHATPPGSLNKNLYGVSFPGFFVRQPTSNFHARHGNSFLTAVQSAPFFYPPFSFNPSGNRVSIESSRANGTR